MAKAQGIGSTAGNSEAAGGTDAPANPPSVNASAPSAAKGRKITAKDLAKELAAIARKPSGAEAASEAKRCATMLHRVHGSTPPDLKKAVAAYYNAPTPENSAALLKAIESEKFDG